jgi:hypothetical protein
MTASVARLPSALMRQVSRAMETLFEDLDVVRWCRERLKERCPFSERAILARTRDERSAHARRTLELIRKADPELSEELERTVWADAALERGVARRRLSPPR